MELRHLRYFIAVAEERSFRRAADRLHVSSSPLIRQIQDLEYEVGVPLLVRSNSGAALTEAGQAVLENARAIVEQSQQLYELARVGSGGKAGHLRIAYSVAHFDAVLPRIVRACREQLPTVRIELQQMDSGQMMQELLERKIDLAFTGIGDSNLTHELVFEAIRRSPVCAVVAQDHPLAAVPAVSLTDLSSETLIFLPRARISWYNNWVLGLCREAGFIPEFVEADTTHSMLGLVAAGVGVAVQPAIVAALPIDVCFRLLEPAPRPFEFQIAWHRKNISAMLMTLLKLLRALVEHAPDGACGASCSPDDPAPHAGLSQASRTPDPGPNDASPVERPAMAGVQSDARERQGTIPSSDFARSLRRGGRPASFRRLQDHGGK